MTNDKKNSPRTRKAVSLYHGFEIRVTFHSVELTVELTINNE